MNSFRQRIRKVGIKCTPWNIWKGEIGYLPISSKTLFKKNGLPIDILERELKEDGWLFPNEILLEVLKDNKNLYRKQLQDIKEDSDFGLIPDNFTQEDYEHLHQERYSNCPF